MKAIEFQKAVYDGIKALMPNCHCSVSKMHMGGGIHIRIGMIKDLVMRDNDPLIVRLCIHDNIKFNDDTQELSTLTIESNGSYISLVPDNPMYHCKNDKIPFRKIKGTPDKVLKSLFVYVQRIKDKIVEDSSKNRIICQSMIDSKYYKFD